MEPTQQGLLPFLDTLVTIELNNTFGTTVYRKPTHTDQYLHWDSNYHITANQSVYNTLAHKGTSENFKRLCKTKGIQVHFKGTNTLRTQLVNPKDKDPKTHKSDITYHYKCPHINCPEAYIGESGRALGERVKEHLKVPSPIFHHSTSTGHPLNSDNFNIIHKKYIVIPGPSRKLCSYVSMTQH